MGTLKQPFRITEEKVAEDRGKIECRNKRGSIGVGTVVRRRTPPMGCRTIDHLWKTVADGPVVAETQDCHCAGAFSPSSKNLSRCSVGKRITSLCLIRRFHRLLEVWTSCTDQRKGKLRAE